MFSTRALDRNITCELKNNTHINNSNNNEDTESESLGEGPFKKDISEISQVILIQPVLRGVVEGQYGHCGQVLVLKKP